MNETRRNEGEAARCVEDGIVASPGDVDMCLILGLALPRYLGGALKYADYSV
ncbi:MAG: hypothetical protein ACREC0_14660 [Methylocella sp.]